ncbi:extracellular catalytic domain type 1 short-chain-length polyhydroxyalkanoate depolymerase [Marinivivus vitaminiproducens]|uniref:extracellular catalytic domain type 1 short-chain-length polyhydroxyalkanoate depolymerase n=1 Tax=Marinivivus vitaminiproducens TaxID=3035935 RepID=UPI0027A35831|nr:PHB depolymerase family esterase [Geminicoccaceae bacterium SCSIO 64248]
MNERPSSFAVPLWQRAARRLRRTYIGLGRGAADLGARAGGQLAHGARFESRRLAGRDYTLFVPSGAVTGVRMPLLVMLHGCAQDPDGFAADTGMNVIAEAETFLVAYPAQNAEANRHRCWNWFLPEHQARGAGEPAWMARLVEAIGRVHKVDERRVYVAGLSAGGAMALVLAATYPDRFAAAAAVAGMPYAAARDGLSAVHLMRRDRETPPGVTWLDPWRQLARSLPQARWPSPVWPQPPPTDAELSARLAEAMAGHRRVVPLVLFQGTDDAVVNPVNAEAIVRQWQGLAAGEAGALRIVQDRGLAPGGRAYTRAVHGDATGREVIGVYTVDGMGHAWPGGRAFGSTLRDGTKLTDPQGPDASRLIWDFVSRHRLPDAAREPAAERPRRAV